MEVYARIQMCDVSIRMHMDPSGCILGTRYLVLGTEHMRIHNYIMYILYILYILYMLPTAHTVHTVTLQNDCGKSIKSVVSLIK